jgi:hypothetical protein
VIKGPYGDDVEATCGAPEVPLFGDGEEVARLSQVHGVFISTCDCSVRSIYWHFARRWVNLFPLGKKSCGQGQPLCHKEEKQMLSTSAKMRILGTVATVGLAPGWWVSAAGAGSAQSGPGCAPERPAVAHHAGGVTVQTFEGKNPPPPIPCTTRTGFRTAEISLVISNEGTLLFQPAFATEAPGLPIGVLRSVDQGGTWQFIDPATNPPRSKGLDMNLWVDRDTGRVFWNGPPDAASDKAMTVDHSDDDGLSWSSSSPISLGSDHSQIFSGPPTERLKSSMQGYPKIIYIVEAGGGTCGSGSTCGTHISKSLDGGLTWSPPVPITYPPECPHPGNDPVGGYGLNGVVDRHGTVYVPFTPCQRPYVAISHDAGETWELSLVANTLTIGWGELGLGLDEGENLYAAWTDDGDRLPYLAISRDFARHWGTPLMVAAPGVNEAALPGLVAGAKGQVAVSIMGARTRRASPFHPFV